MVSTPRPPAPNGTQPHRVSSRICTARFNKQPLQRAGNACENGGEPTRSFPAYIKGPCNVRRPSDAAWAACMMETTAAACGMSRTGSGQVKVQAVSYHASNARRIASRETEKKKREAGQQEDGATDSLVVYYSSSETGTAGRSVTPHTSACMAGADPRGFSLVAAADARGARTGLSVRFREAAAGLGLFIGSESSPEDDDEACRFERAATPNDRAV